MFTVFVHTQGL